MVACCRRRETSWEKSRARAAGGGWDLLEVAGGGFQLAGEMMEREKERCGWRKGEMSGLDGGRRKDKVRWRRAWAPRVSVACDASHTTDNLCDRSADPDLF